MCHPLKIGKKKLHNLKSSSPMKNDHDYTLFGWIRIKSLKFI